MGGGRICVHRSFFDAETFIWKIDRKLIKIFLK